MMENKTTDYYFIIIYFYFVDFNKLILIIFSITVEDDEWRVSISIRRPVDNGYVTENSQVIVKPDSSTTKPPRKRVTLIAGDSFTERLDATRLGRKGRKTIINVSKGGSTIGHVGNQLDQFFVSNSDNVVSQLFISVGTNDIRHCRAGGVKHLKKALSDLIAKSKLLFPEAKIWFQCIIPLPVQHIYSIKNVIMFNSLLWEVCSNKKVYIMDCFDMFLGRNGYRLEVLFKGRDDVHPNNVGLGLLARCYIKLIHSRNFNPLGY